MQKISFKSHYIIPSIKSNKNIRDIEKNFIGITYYLTDKTKENNIVYTKKGVLIKVIDCFDKNFENLAKFYNFKFFKK